jgi:hypothetical protein
MVILKKHHCFETLMMIMTGFVIFLSFFEYRILAENMLKRDEFFLILFHIVWINRIAKY